MFAAFKPLPKLEYACPEGLIESDDKILKLPERIAAINEVAGELRSFASAAWWQTNVDDLNACEMHGSAGSLTDEEKAHFRDGDYQFLLFGNQQIRLVLVRDPCYQTGFNGSNLFALYRTLRESDSLPFPTISLCRWPGPLHLAPSALRF